MAQHKQETGGSRKQDDASDRPFVRLARSVTILAPLVGIACLAKSLFWLDGFVFRALVLSSRDGVFFCTLTSSGYEVLEVITVIPVFFVSIALVSLAVPSNRKTLKFAPRAWAATAGVSPSWQIPALVMYLLVVLFYLFALSSNVCLSDNELYYRPNIFFPLQTYRLSDGAVAKPVCRHGKSWYAHLHVRMPDDTSFDLSRLPYLYQTSSQRILAVLRDVPLDTSGIASGCPLEAMTDVMPRH